MKRFFTIVFCIMTSYCIGQTLSYSRGQIQYFSKTITPVLGQVDPLEIDITHNFNFSMIPLKSNKHLLVGLNYFRMSGWTAFAYSLSKTVGAGQGTAYTKVRRIGIDIKYLFFSTQNKLNFYPLLKIDKEFWDVQVPGLTLVNIFLEEERGLGGDIYTETYNGGQILPSIGLGVSLNLFWRIVFTGEMYYSFGNKAYQRMYFDYTYYGLPQKRAEWIGDGTGFIQQIGIGIKLW